MCYGKIAEWRNSKALSGNQSIPYSVPLLLGKWDFLFPFSSKRQCWLDLSLWWDQIVHSRWQWVVMDWSMSFLLSFSKRIWTVRTCCFPADSWYTMNKMQTWGQLLVSKRIQSCPRVKITPRSLFVLCLRCWEYRILLESPLKWWIVCRKVPQTMIRIFRHSN